MPGFGLGRVGGYRYDSGRGGGVGCASSLGRALGRVFVFFEVVGRQMGLRVVCGSSAVEWLCGGVGLGFGLCSRRRMACGCPELMDAGSAGVGGLCLTGGGVRADGARDGDCCSPRRMEGRLRHDFQNYILLPFVKILWGVASRCILD